MPFQVPDQSSVELGRSRITPADTYSPVADPRRNVQYGGGLQELGAALSKMGVEFGDEARQRDEVRQKQLQLDFENYANAAERDNRLATETRESYNRANPGSSEVTRMYAVQRMGARYVEKAIEEDWQKLSADESILSNPTLLKEKMKEFRTKYTDLLGQNNDPLFRAGGLQFYNKWEESILTDGRKLSVDEMQKANMLTFSRENQSQSTFRAAQVLAHDAAVKAGLPPAYLVPFLAKENPKGDPKALNESGSTAGGLFQITDGTWDYLVSKYGAKYGITKDMKLDGNANALMAAEYAKESIAFLRTSLGRNPTPGEVYFAHLLGPSGAKSFFETVKEDPNADPVKLLGADLVRNNAGIFYKDPKNRQGLMTVGEAFKKNVDDIHSNNFYMVPTVRYDGKERVLFDRNTFAAKNYSWMDFKNNGEYGGDGKIDSRLVGLLDRVTDQFGKKLKLTSAYRDGDYNSKTSWTGQNGPHTHSDAIDVDVSQFSDAEKAKLVSLFVANGANGIGHYKNGSIHIDLGHSRGGKGSQPDGMALWYEQNKPYTEGEKWFADGVEQGRDYRAGGMVPAAGFNGQPLNPIEARIRDGAKYGLRPSVARESIVTDMVQSALANSDFNMGRKMLNDLVSNANLVPRELAKVAEARTAIDQHEGHQIDLAIKRQHQLETQQNKMYEQVINDEKAESLRTGKPFNAAKWLGVNRHAYEYARSVANDELIDAGQSAAASSMLINRIMKERSLTADSANYDFMGRKAGDKAPTHDEFVEYINSRKDLRTDDRKKLIDQLPKMLAGLDLVHNSIATDWFKTSVGDRVDAFYKSAEGKMGSAGGFQYIEDIKGRARAAFSTQYSALIRNHLLHGGDPNINSDLNLQFLKEAAQVANSLADIAMKNNGQFPEGPQAGAVTQGDITTFIQPAPQGSQFMSTTTIGGIPHDNYMMPNGTVKVVPRGSMQMPPTVSYPPALPVIEQPAAPPAPAKEAKKGVTGKTGSEYLKAVNEQYNKPKPEQEPTPVHPGVQQIMNNLEDLKNWALGGTPEQRAAYPKLQIQADDQLKKDAEYRRLWDVYQNTDSELGRGKPENERPKSIAYLAMKNYADDFRRRYIAERMPPDIVREPNTLYQPTKEQLKNKK